MKLMMRPTYQVKTKARQLMLLIGLLLFLPIAQAQHLSTHDFSVGEINCLVCHANIDIAGNIPEELAQLDFDSAKEMPLTSVKSNIQHSYSHHKAIRAPPFFT